MSEGHDFRKLAESSHFTRLEMLGFPSCHIAAYRLISHAYCAHVDKPCRIWRMSGLGFDGMSIDTSR